MFTFKKFLAEVEDIQDVEDLSSEELKQRAQAMMKRAQLKASGREDQANKQSIRDLQIQLRDAKDPRQRADLQRRLKELMTKKPEDRIQ